MLDVLRCPASSDSPHQKICPQRHLMAAVVILMSPIAPVNPRSPSEVATHPTRPAGPQGAYERIHVLTYRSGKVVRLVIYARKQKALAAVGWRE